MSPFGVFCPNSLLQSTLILAFGYPEAKACKFKKCFAILLHDCISDYHSNHEFLGVTDWGRYSIRNMALRSRDLLMGSMATESKTFTTIRSQNHE